MDGKIEVKDYSYELPEEKIAIFPLAERDVSKLLVYKNGIINEDIFRHLDNYLAPNSFLVRNNTRVIRARLLFKTDTGAPIELFILEPYEQSIEQALQQTKGPLILQCLIGNKRKWKQEKLALLHRINKKNVNLEVKMVGETSDAVLVEFVWNGDELSFGKLLEEFGKIPLPPYIKRRAVEGDASTYQTTFAAIEGSVAAPTAGLHYTAEMQVRLEKKGIEMADVTLHVGAGTFKPIKVEEAHLHIMHEEEVVITRSFIEKLLKALVEKKEIIALGTTSLRTLESLYGYGLRLIEGYKENEIFSVSQWELYKTTKISPQESIAALLDYMLKNELQTIQGKTQIMIVPGFEFKMADALITNFHQPGSTLLMLVAAFIGDDWKKVYDYAMKNHFRFLSYGDGSLLRRKV